MAEESPKRHSLPEKFEEFQSIRLTDIEPGEEQPRDNFDEAKLQELAQSICAHGIIQPITVSRTSGDKYRIIAGERRWRAAKLADLEYIPALVRQTDKEDLLELALIENIQREDLNAIEIALAFERLHSEHGLSHDQIASRTGKERSTVTNFLRLLKLSPAVQGELVRGTISMGHARALLNIGDEAKQLEICEAIKAKHLSVRETEALVRQTTVQPGVGHSDRKAPQREEEKPDPNERVALEEMSMALGTRVRLNKRSESSGRLEIEYYTAEDLERIYGVIVK